MRTLGLDLSIEVREHRRVRSRVGIGGAEVSTASHRIGRGVHHARPRNFTAALTDPPLNAALR